MDTPQELTAQLVKSALREHETAHIAELAEFVAIPSVSADPSRTDEMGVAAAWLVRACERAGLESCRAHPTTGNPIVTAEWLQAGPDAPTVVIYGHYDVQPAEPLAEWLSDPWTLTMRDDRLFGRGSTDDKGQLFMYLKVIQAMLETEGRLPINVRLFADGEEEVGSPSLPAFLAANPSSVAGDIGMVSDSPMYGLNLPSVGYALRGVASFEFTIQTANGDLHSGQFGGAVPNAAHVAAAIVAGLHDENGRVSVPGFYADVADVPDDERAAFAALDFDEGAWLGAIGVESTVGEGGYSTLERTWIRPTLDVNGVWGGYTGSGSKTIVPASVTVKLSCRLVPDQDCDTIVRAVEDHIRSLVPAGVRLTVQHHHNVPPVVVPSQHPAVRLSVDALRSAFGSEPVIIRDGGSIPAVGLLQQLGSLDCVLLGFGCPDENKHAPNEWLPMTHFRSGMDTLLQLFLLLAATPRATLSG